MVKLIMLPYAGSLGYAYQKLQSLEDDNMQIIMIDYNGRGRRHKLQYATSWEELINETFYQIKDIISDNIDYVIFGHSMGAKVACDLYYKISEQKLDLPKCIIFSGSKALNCPIEDFKNMSEDQFLRRFINLGGISDKVLENRELSEMVYEALKEDTSLLSDYKYDGIKKKISCDVVVINGSEDDFSSEEEWNKLLEKKCIYKMFDGGHFFIFSGKEQVCHMLKEIIQR